MISKLVEYIVHIIMFNISFSGPKVGFKSIYIT